MASGIVALDSESQGDLKKSRLGICTNCSVSEAKYCCPACQATSCSLDCVKEHKVKNSCSGKRDRTKFLRVSEFTDLDLHSDYCLLEEITRDLDVIARETWTKKKWFQPGKNRNPSVPVEFLPRSLRLLKFRARSKPRRCRLLFLPKHFSRRSENTSFFDVQKKAIFWKVDLHLPHSDESLVLPEVHEKTKVFFLLSPYIEPKPDLSLEQDRFLPYRSAGFGGIRVLLKLEHCNNQRDTEKRFLELDLKKSLQYNLRGTTVVENPIIYVILAHHSSFFPSLDMEDIQSSKKVREADQEKQDAEQDSDREEESDTENDFGLISGSKLGDDDSESKRAEKRQHETPSASYVFEELDRKRPTDEEAKMMLAKKAKIWKAAMKERDDSSLLNAFAMQGEDRKQAEQEFQAEVPQGKAEEVYKQYYDFYMKYYQSKYGIDETPKDKEGSMKKSEKSAIVSYDDSSSEEEEEDEPKSEGNKTKAS